MPDVVISVDRLSKRYRLGEIGRRTLRDDVTRAWARLRGAADPLGHVGSGNGAGVDRETIWALREVSFDVGRGEVMGIVGRNGAGKSTLLKILSRITAPTAGEIKVKGRVASLLEVGTGFHPELTGRENIYLNGAILGMRRAEIARKFDAIVDFSGVEPFIETPVKRYSSGMSVRLAFAVAAHLEPEILVVDEVLAVGDLAFQKKCLGKLGEVAGREGRTVLFVSHNLAMVEALCERVALLDEGRLVALGSASDVLARYSIPLVGARHVDLRQAPRTGNGDVQLTEVSIVEGAPRTGAALQLLIRFDPRRPAARVRNVGVSIWSAMDERLISVETEVTAREPLDLRDHVVCTFPSLPLVRGSYWVNVHVDSTQGLADYVVHAMPLDVLDSDFYGTGRGPHPTWTRIVTPCEWRVLKDGEAMP